MFRPDLRDNLPMKVFAVLLAVLCWAVVRSEEVRVKNFTVPLDYINLPATVELSGRVVETVRIRLRAPEAVMRSITGDQLVASVDLSNSPTGEQHVRLSDSLIRVPPGSEVESISPELITVRLEKRVQREVPVFVEFAGRPAQGHRKIRHVIEPPEVTIEGPESAVSAVRRVLTGTIVLEGETGDVEVDVRPVPDARPGSRVRIISPSGPVRVRVIIQPIVSGNEAEPVEPGKQRQST